MKIETFELLKSLPNGTDHASHTIPEATFESVEGRPSVTVVSFSGFGPNLHCFRISCLAQQATARTLSYSRIISVQRFSRFALTLAQHRETNNLAILRDGCGPAVRASASSRSTSRGVPGCESLPGRTISAKSRRMSLLLAAPPSDSLKRHDKAFDSHAGWVVHDGEPTSPLFQPLCFLLHVGFRWCKRARQHSCCPAGAVMLSRDDSFNLRKRRQPPCCRQQQGKVQPA